MPDSAATALIVFEEHLTQIETGLCFVAAATAAKKNAPAAVDWSGPAYEVGQVRLLLEAEPYPEQLLCNANYLSSVAAYEEFLRQALDSAVLSYVASTKSFDNLSAEVQDFHMKATGRLLTMRSKPPQQLVSLNFFEVCRKIGSCLPGSTEFELNSEALCLLQDLIVMDSFFETLEKFGYAISWDVLGASAELSACLLTTGTRETAKALKVFVADMARQRNRIAHTGTSVSEVTTASLEEHLGVLRALGRAVSGAL